MIETVVRVECDLCGTVVEVVERCVVQSSPKFPMFVVKVAAPNGNQEVRMHACSPCAFSLCEKRKDVRDALAVSRESASPDDTGRR